MPRGFPRRAPCIGEGSSALTPQEASFAVGFRVPIALRVDRFAAAVRSGYADRDLRRRVARRLGSLLRSLRKRQVGAQLTLTIHFDGRGVSQRLPLRLRRLRTHDAFAERLPRGGILFACDFHMLSFSDAM